MQTTATTWMAVQRGEDLEAREALTIGHLRLVKHIVSQIMRSTRVMADFDDLVSAGTIGLINAVDNFDPSRGLAFSTFAAPRIRGSILDDLRRRDHAPRSIRRRQRDMSRAREKATLALGRPPSDQEMADELNIDIDKLWSWQSDAQRAEQISFDQPAIRGGNQSVSIEELVSGQDDHGIETLLNHREEVELLRDGILSLKEQERIVLSLYYFEELKLREIGTVLGVTESRISQIHSKAIASLRSRMLHLRSES